MRPTVARRQILSRAVQLAAAGGLVGTASAEAPLRPRAGHLVRIRWQARRGGWPARPSRSAAAVIFVSTHDADAPQPADFDLLTGDVWWRHPGSAGVVAQVPGV